MSRISIFVLIFSIYFLIPECANAAEFTANSVSCVLCKIANLITGTIGRSLAIIIIIAVGFMLFVGKLTWGLAFAIFIGMGLIFGAENVVKLIGGFDDEESLCKYYENQKCDKIGRSRSAASSDI